MEFKPSNYQEDIFDRYTKTNSSLVINATAGSGKTRTIIELLKLTPKNKKTIFLAFNKSIATELQTKVSDNIKVSTIHSFGVSLLYKNLTSKIKITEYKNFGLAKKNLKITHIKQDKLSSYIFNLSRMVDMYRVNLCNDRISFESKLDELGVYTLNGELDFTLQLIDVVDKYNKKEHKIFEIDFTDMLYLPHLFNLEFPKYDIVFIDEVQDLSLLQKRIIDKIIKPKTGRFVAVGDKFQSIYSFIGANKQSFQEFVSHPNTIELPLSVSYRCSKKIVEVANNIFGSIESFEGNEEGEVINNGNLNNIQDGDFVLCRNNLPLLELWMELIDKDKKAVIYGKEYEKGLIQIIDKLNIKEDIYKQLDRLLTNLKESLKEKNFLKPELNPKYQSLLERVTIIKILLKKYNSIEIIELKLNEIFSDNISKGIILMSIHKSKGLESNNVYFYKPNLIPSKYAETQDEIFSEKCLYFVAVTRAKKKLIFIN